MDPDHYDYGAETTPATVPPGPDGFASRVGPGGFTYPNHIPRAPARPEFEAYRENRWLTLRFRSNLKHSGLAQCSMLIIPRPTSLTPRPRGPATGAAS